MKIQCDVCNKHNASLFCTDDEAALCHACDHRVHHANKLASKHHRFSLTHPSPKHFPMCDVCQERRAFVFCQQDRAILCKECDGPIHSANELTKKHNRFLLTGIKFSATATPYSSSQPPKNNPVLHSSQDSPSLTNAQTGFIGSSISEYLINTIPGMKFEDFLDSHSLPSALPENGDDMFGEGNMEWLWQGGSGVCVPEAPYSFVYFAEMDKKNGNRETREGSIRSSVGDDNFIVPQLSPANKRSRLLW